MELSLGQRYCIDTSSLIALKRHYFGDIFVSLWNNIGQMAEEGALIAPSEVHDEIARRDDDLFDWAKKHSCLFVELDIEQISFAMDIMRRFPNLIDPNKEIPDADPFVVSLARSKGCSVITEEKAALPGAGRTKIPNVCQNYNIEYLSLYEFFKHRNWKF